MKSKQMRLPDQYSIELTRQLCHIAGPRDMVRRQRHELKQTGILAAVKSHNTPALFDWLISTVSLQGVSDRAAYEYMDKHGNLTWDHIAAVLEGQPSCGKLRGYWAFEDCRYHKTSQTCTEPDHFDACPLPKKNLRNGRLNQTAFALYFFIRDIMDGDIVAWIDRQLATAESAEDARASECLDQALIAPLRNVYGVSDKVLSLAFAMLLIGAGADRPKWFEAGINAVAVDTLVHNFLSRSGILRRLRRDHPYGPACFTDEGCTGVLNMLVDHIDARPFGNGYPARFPRFIQSTIWSFCAADSFNVCNGNNVDDSKRCGNRECELYAVCDRRRLTKA